MTNQHVLRLYLTNTIAKTYSWQVHPVLLSSTYTRTGSFKSLFFNIYILQDSLTTARKQAQRTLTNAYNYPKL